jgi:HicB_like antitoxin of bacterial toxin-antitoxin system
MRYAVVIEKGERNYSAYVPDLPGCVSVGDTLEDVKAEIREAIEGSYSVECWYGPFPMAPLIQIGGASWSPQASRARRQPR